MGEAGKEMPQFFGILLFIFYLSLPSLLPFAFIYLCLHLFLPISLPLSTSLYSLPLLLLLSLNECSRPPPHLTAARLMTGSTRPTGFPT